MQIFSLLAIFFALLVAIFAVQNAGPVEINFLSWQFSNISLVLVILGSAAFGALVVFLLGAVRQVRQAREIRELKSQLKRLQETIAHREQAAAGAGAGAGRLEREQEA
ncbi:Lipopolysaccharide assembly protein A domain protein [Neomoorella glycerini]|uniref:Lipopolysaccharide assembly protein A domain protein n=1 Tax=Neomoorella glycerini TaxID=55779 RepID=A0A6I5ZMG8_9FIRM|nr:LapA family protein [Moorella glycerini]QGP90767.1 Lipopolysaccharide assembly protein A domain protein [Moorella glycerini]